MAKKYQVKGHDAYRATACTGADRNPIVDGSTKADAFDRENKIAGGADATQTYFKPAEELFLH